MAEEPGPRPGSGRPLLPHAVRRRDPGAPWLVLVHGAGLTSAIWRPQVEAFAGEFNLLLPELHGGAPAGGQGEGITFETVAGEVLDLLDHHGVEAAHFMGISMGCLVVRLLADLAPERVSSMVLAGAIGRLKVRARILIGLAHVLKGFVPHMWLYRFYAWILLPRRGHLESRRVVVREARDLTRSEFLRWLPVTTDLPDMLRRFESRDPGIPTLYVMGDEDHMFLPGVRAVAAAHASASLHVVGGCGHVCTIQRADAFNRVSLDFLRAASV